MLRPTRRSSDNAPGSLSRPPGASSRRGASTTPRWDNRGARRSSSLPHRRIARAATPRRPLPRLLGACIGALQGQAAEVRLARVLGTTLTLGLGQQAVGIDLALEAGEEGGTGLLR